MMTKCLSSVKMTKKRKNIAKNISKVILQPYFGFLMNFDHFHFFRKFLVRKVIRKLVRFRSVVGGTDMLYPFLYTLDTCF